MRGSHNELPHAPQYLHRNHWRDRAPFTDEQAAGIQIAQSRLLVRARQRNSTSALGEVYVVNVSIENRVRVAGAETWTEASATTAYRAWANAITEDFKRELSVGVRKY